MARSARAASALLSAVVASAVVSSCSATTPAASPAPSASSAPVASASSPAAAASPPPREVAPPIVSAPVASSAAPPSPPVASDAPPPQKKRRVVSAGGTKLPGGTWLATPCVDPVLDVAARTNQHLEGMFTADESADLDGDGAADLVVFQGAANLTDTRSFYVRRGPCGHFVGAVSSSANLAFTDTRARGLLQLRGRSRCQVECCAHDVIETWGFDGARYRKQREERVPPCEKTPRSPP
ncbi:MAG: hypothetical protein IT374_12485 [Polyangiaceae bacterium]|nr:hypothetical protein [Polyangiaceae bacterium]